GRPPSRLSFIQLPVMGVLPSGARSASRCLHLAASRGRAAAPRPPRFPAPPSCSKSQAGSRPPSRARSSSRKYPTGVRGCETPAATAPPCKPAFHGPRPALSGAMLKIRLIPCLDVADGRVVKGVNFVDLIDAGDPVQAAAAYDAAGADELCFLDIHATHENRGTMYDLVSRTAEKCFIPLTVGGGVRTPDDVRALLLAGAD